MRKKRPLVRRTILGFGVVVLGFLVVLGVEVWLALRREYLPTDNPFDLDGTFGSGDGVPLDFVVLGDSTSAGVGVDDPDDAYPSVLARRLAAETGRPVRLTVLGVSGARVGDLLDEQVSPAVAAGPELVFVGIGANDVTHLTSLGKVRDDMSEALEALGSTGASLVVAGAPDMRVYAFHQPLRHLTYLRGNQVTGAIEEVARAEGAAVVELAEETGPFFAEDPEAHFSEDRFHPNALGYRRWADAIFPVLAEAVGG